LVNAFSVARCPSKRVSATVINRLREVLLQFLIEAVVLAALGGLVGIVLATGASIVLANVMDVPYLFNPGVNLLSFIFSAGIGVLFGYFPARRAARMDPIEALRHE
jgi:putative ABC transport system permease protein